jgi:hypothetical protein
MMFFIFICFKHLAAYSNTTLLSYIFMRKATPLQKIIKEISRAFCKYLQLEYMSETSPVTWRNIGDYFSFL